MLGCRMAGVQRQRIAGIALVHKEVGCLGSSCTLRAKMTVSYFQASLSSEELFVKGAVLPFRNFILDD